jgi:hypothetical protein
MLAAELGVIPGFRVPAESESGRLSLSPFIDASSWNR